MSNEEFRVLFREGKYTLQAVDVMEPKRTVYWISEMNPNVNVGVGKIIDIEASTDEEAIITGKLLIEDLRGPKNTKNNI